MNKKYRIKRDALPFFDPKYATWVKEKPIWLKNQVSEFAIEEVEDCYISAGIKNANNVTQMSGWSSLTQECHFEFTLNFQDTDSTQYDHINNPEKIRDLMDQLHVVGNNWINENRLF